MVAMVAAMYNTANGAIPTGYYSQCEGKTGVELLKALNATISSHTVVSYNGLWTLYKTSDVDENGKIWDMYSTKRWNPGGEQCGSYSKVGDCYNREHSFPQSWFNEGSPMKSDAFHIYPTDGKVNNQRNNYPFGECASGTTLSSSGSVKALGKLGKCTFSGYSGTVFEPDDQYKGDFARSYFYMAACYRNVFSSWKGSDMIDTSSDLFYKTWAINLLLKWTRQDEVSEKELKRQEVVYGKQKNRNPFIDHPELAEYIWGNKKGQAWYSSASAAEPEITQPADGTVISLGYAATGITRSMSVTVKGKNLTENVKLSVSGAGYSVSPTSITATQGNQGYNATISYKGSTPGDAEGLFTISSGTATRTVDITTTVESGLPTSVTDVTSDGFTVTWVYLNDATTYTLDVKQGGTSVSGYPKTVTASTEKYTVTGLDPSTTYTYTLTGNVKSEEKSVTTADLIPEIIVLFDGQLHFDTTVGVASDIAELLIGIENIADEVTVTVNQPFEISTDKTNWSTTTTLAIDEDRLYLRMLGTKTGDYTTSIVFKAGDYLNDEATATGTISEPQEEPAFIETFNVDATYANQYAPYKNGSTFTGTATDWTLKNAGIGTSSDDKKIDASYSIRFGKEASSALTMAKDKTGGMGEISFQTLKWKTDADVDVEVEYSADGGITWETIGSISVTASSTATTVEPETWKFTVNRSGSGRIRIRQTSGSLWFVDNISISNYAGVAAIKELEYHHWDAFCRSGELVIENHDESREIAVYGIDGVTYLDGRVNAGETTMRLPKGLYIVVSNDFSRRVVVK